MPADTATADAFADGQREARESDRRALVAALGLSDEATWAAALSYATRHAEDNTDPTLQGMCRTSNAWMQTAAMHARNEDYYRGLLVACATHLGPAVYVQDDGGVVIDPLLAKVPELVAAMREHIAALTTTLLALRAQLDRIAAVGWDASCESAAADVLEAEDAARLNRYAVRVARERDRHRDLNLSSLIAFGRLVDRAGPDRPFNIGPPFRAELLRLMDALSGAVEAGIPFDPLDAAMVPPDGARHDDGDPDAD